MNTDYGIYNFILIIIKLNEHSPDHVCTPRIQEHSWLESTKEVEMSLEELEPYGGKKSINSIKIKQSLGRIQIFKKKKKQTKQNI